MPRKRILKVEVVHNSLKEAKGFGAKFLDLNAEEKDTLEQLVQLFGEEPEATTTQNLQTILTADFPASTHSFVSCSGWGSLACHEVSTTTRYKL